jgi:hypothetical protein
MSSKTKVDTISRWHSKITISAIAALIVALALFNREIQNHGYAAIARGSGFVIVAPVNSYDWSTFSRPAGAAAVGGH